MTDTQRLKRIERAQMRVLFQVPFFAPGVAKLRNVIDSSVDTACTDGDLIRWNPEFMDTLNDDVLVTVLCHEVCHCLLGHLWRAPVGCDWDLWNQATDHAVNLMLKEFGEQVQSRRMANPFPFPEPAEAYCANPAFSGKAEETIYGLLAGSKPPDGNQGSKPGNKGQGQGKGKPGGGVKSSMPSFGQMSQPTSGQDTAKKKQNDWQNTLIQSIAANKSRGELPGSLNRLVKDMLESDVSWTDIVKNLLREQANDDWNWMKPNRFYDESGFILPSLDNERIASLVVGIDTSGSIDHELLAKFKGVMQSAMDELRPNKLVEICCDTRVTAEREYRPGDTIAPDAPGGGGTALGAIFECIAEREYNPRAVVILTDLQTSFPKEPPPYPVIWVVWGSEREAPFGEIVPVDR